MNDLTVEYSNATASWIGGHLVLAYSNATEQGTLKLPGKATVHILAVGGGGAGGSTTASTTNGAGGGGGAGGFVEKLNQVMAAGDYTINVGAGGAALTVAETTPGNDGGASVISNNTAAIVFAYGGGGGGAKSEGSPGGSGGGGSYVSAAKAGGSAIDASQGNAGGSGAANRFAGGGGGAGGTGGKSGASQTGGAGKISYILSEDMATGGSYYAGGGAGGKYATGAIAGGEGGGGSGAAAANVSAQQGIDGTGGGGGGGSRSSAAIGGKGGDGVVIIRIAELLDTLVPPPVKPDDAEEIDGVWVYEWDGSTRTVFPATSLAYTLAGESSESMPGDYSFTVTLNDDFTWKGLTGAEAEAPISVAWKISTASNYINNLSIRKWETGAVPNAPACEVRYGTPEYSYRLKSAEDIEENYSATPPEEEGEYVLRAVVEEDPEKRWARAEAKCEFIVFTGALDIHTDYVDYNIEATTLEGLPVSNFPVRVVLKEGVPYGFKYEDAVVDGVNTVRFYDSDSGEPLSFSNEVWNVNGESVYWVKVPEIAASARVTIYWGVKSGKTPVPMEESETWSDYSKAEASSAQGGIEGAFGLVTNAGDRKYHNYFTKNPYMTDTDWYVGDEVTGTVGSTGELADGGAITNYFVNRYTLEEHTSMPEGAGAYAAVFKPVDTSMCYEFEYTIEFMIRDRTPVNAIAGTNGDSGRVLLMNDDNNALCKISNQGYNRTSPSTSTWWDFDASEDDFVPASSVYKYLKTGYEFKLRKMGSAEDKGEILWNLVNCRHGNTFRGTSLAAGVVDSENYLPWDPKSIWNTAPAPVRGRADGVGTLVMRNMIGTTSGDGAVVYSKYFEDGIGTIYFDAVNQMVDATAEDCALKVSIATTCKDGVTPATDDAVGISNRYEHADWKDVRIFALRREKTAAGTYAFELDNEEGVEELPLTIKAGGETNNFYRVYVPVNIQGPVRFKIERTKQSDRYQEDNGNFIILDNIIVSKPPMTATLVPYGTNDTSRVGKDVMGWAGAMSVAFPSAGDSVFARAACAGYTNDLAEVADAMSFITSARVHYRWRYLEQRAVPSFGRAWYSTELNPGNGFKAFEPLDLPGGVGDVEFYFTGTLQAPYYEYVDYSGTGLGVPGYTEEITDFKSGWSDELESNHKARADWFVRLRDGASGYEALKVEYKFGDTGSVKTNTMEIVQNHTWRGYIQTPTNTVGTTFYYRVLAVNLQENESPVYAENCEVWGDQLVTNSLPVSGSLVKLDDETVWSSVYNDAKTGHMMFQVDDRTRGLTLVHADYQDFNNWNDAAASTLQLFVGRDDETDERLGVSAEQRTFTETFDTWLDMPAESPRWQLSFPTGVQFRAEAGYPAYETFANNWYNGWDIKQGMWVAERYRNNSTGAALQMEGCGRGGVEYVQSPAPRGIDEIKFNARLGQSISFENFSYYDAGARERQSMTNYTFASRVAFDGKKNEAYRGNASLSLVAHYIPGRGCYEARWEQIGDHPSSNGNYIHNKNNSMGNRGQRLVILRWNVDSTGKYTATEERAWTNTVVSLQKRTNTEVDDDFRNDTTLDLAEQKYLPFYISVSNTATSVIVYTGVRLGAAAMNGMESQDAFTSSEKTWRTLRFTDETANQHRSGTYGLVSANCEGIFHAPAFHSGPAVVEGYKNNGDACITKFSTSQLCRSDITNDYWYYQYGRMEAFFGNAVAQDYGFKAAPVTQKLYVSLRNPSLDGSDSAWKTVWTNEFNSFGTSSQVLDFSTNLYHTADSQVRFQVGGDVDDVRVDVVIDEIVVSQWRGDDWANAGDYVNGGDNRIETGDSYYTFTNFTFSSAWIKDGGILLSARRTTGAKPAAVKGPLFDGMYGRGSGLGKFSFSYSNAQENASMLLQIATNVNYTTASAANLDVHDEAIWHTISNFSFAALSDAERASGSRTVYTGLHGVQGMFRLVVDPNTVTNVAGNSTDKTLFGEILITEVSCSDEPAINERAWWGWNIRSVGQNGEGADIDWEHWDNQDGCNAEGRTYLPDFSENLAYAGRSMALNNSWRNPEAKILPDGISDSEEEVYRRHMPFVQSPTFTEDIVGEVSFKARKFKTTPGSRSGDLVLYGARKGKTTDAADESWTRIQTFSITNDAFQTYTYKTPPGGVYSAFRLAVPLSGDNVERIIIDEFLVCEAVRPNVKLRNVGAFRNHMSDLTFVAGVPGVGEQPLCNESWGVQCEVYASQLPDEVDFEAREPKVYLSWYKGILPWGFDNWKDYEAASGLKKMRVQLSPVAGTNLVYRSTNLGLAENVVPASTVPGEVVQYMLEVVYYNKDNLTTPITNRLDESMWRVPEWYNPVDYNARPPVEGSTFAAFNILDTVAPDWAWINEVNVFGMFDNVSDENTDVTQQYVEIAAPVEASLDGWEVRLLERADDMIVTNIAATFGTENLPATKDSVWSASNMVFHVVASPYTFNKKELTRENGKLDGVWSIPNPGTVLGQSGEISTIYPFAVQLVRPSGIVEHEVVVSGTNLWAQYEGYGLNGDVDYVAGRMNEISRKAGFNSSFYGAGYDNGPADASLGVVASHGETAALWNNTMYRTPGRINQGQQISADHPTPNGEEIFIYSNLDQTLPHVKQTFGDLVSSNSNTMIVYRKGALVGTNITYTVDKWYDLAAVTTNGAPAAFNVGASPRTYTIEVGRGASNNVTVTAFAGVSPRLADYGLDASDPYTPAVMEWLTEAKDVHGNPWSDQESETVHLAKFIDYSNTFITNLTLKQMYWLDIDPTRPETYFKAGFSSAPATKPASTGNNVLMSLYMCISNDTPETAYSSRAPEVLRGLEPGSHSLNYTQDTQEAWDGPTLNVRGILYNNKTDGSIFSENWVPLRWFVFNAGSFHPKGHDREFQSLVEIIDPRSSESPGSTAGWDKYPDIAIGFSWRINTQRLPTEVEPMRKENTYEE